MEFLIGLTLALGVSLVGKAAGLDRDRAFYTSVALAIGTYYLLFAVMGGSSSALMQEIAAYLVLAALAVTGFRTSPWLVVVALVGHGIFDVFHGELIENDGVPAYWPMFCMSYDVTAGVYLALLLCRQPFSRTVSDGWPLDRPLRAVGTRRRSAGDERRRELSQARARACRVAGDARIDL
jgi:hypothetical protein